MTNSSVDLKFWVALDSFPKFGPARLKKLKDYFPTMEAAFRADARELAEAGLGEALASEFSAARNSINPDELLEKLASEEIEVILVTDARYPRLLKEIYNPPSILYYKGHLETEENALAVVGARKYSTYGKQATEDLVEKLAAAGLTIVSGLAYGIDSLAHNACLRVGGRTIAVLASGLDKQNIYPASNRYLAQKIITEGGLLVSEFPCGTPPLRHHFPQRNRIISGLSQAVLIIEAAEKSGSLITIQYALEQNRDVFAVPGSIFSPLSAGTNRLIKQGATPVTSVEDILTALDLSGINSYSKKIEPQNDEEKELLSFLTFEPIHINELIRLSGRQPAQLSGLLVMMEMRGLIRDLGGMRYVLAK